MRESIEQILTQTVGAGNFTLTESCGDLVADLPKEKIVDICRALNSSAECSFDMCVDITAADNNSQRNTYEKEYNLNDVLTVAKPAPPRRYSKTDRFAVIYNLWSNKNKFRLRLRVAVDQDAHVQSVTGVWRSANWYERETFDMFGVVFDGHPDLRRMYMPDDFNDPVTGQPLYPLRKDFPLMGIEGSIPLPPRDEKPVEIIDINQPIATSEYGTVSREHPKILQALLGDNTQVEISDPLENDMVLNLGPQHPATHGVLRVLLRLDGETVLNAVPELGYLHRGYEKIAENATYHEFIPHTDRLDYISPVANNVAYALAVEKLAHLEAPPRAQYIRTICSELARISSHLMATGATAMDVGAMTMLLWTFREREKLYDIFDRVTGVRFTTSFTRVGGVAQDLTDEGIAMIRKFIDELHESITEYEKLLNRNRIFVDRMANVGTLAAADAIALGITGPSLRASGIARDLRRDAPYLVYNDLDFNVITRSEGDCLARYLARVDEMKESVKIVRQCLDKLPAGPIYAEDAKLVLPRKNEIYTKMEELIDDFMIINFGINPPPGDSYFAVDSAKGELGFYFVSDGSGYPYRMKIRSPSFGNLQALAPLMRGAMISDTVAIIGSLDPIMGEADK